MRTLHHHGSISWFLYKQIRVDFDGYYHEDVGQKKRLQVDGHYLEDVIEVRKRYCKLMEELESCFLTCSRSTPLSSEGETIGIFHDEY